ncbi:hypothetical protein GCM10010869_55310 [Mesorhizobium tianshanense]|nr:hypothetical protein GCM10010869_55310 [Mesorhizobium tianshanense]
MRSDWNRLARTGCVKTVVDQDREIGADPVAVRFHAAPAVHAFAADAMVRRVFGMGWCKPNCSIGAGWLETSGTGKMAAAAR